MSQQGYYLYQFNEHVDTSCKYLFEKYGYPETVVEIGVYQGYFTINMTHTIAPTNSRYKHYSIDPYTESPDLENDMIAQAYRCFEHNLSITPYRRNIEFLRTTSFNGLMQLLQSGVRADFIYVDGNHTSPCVLEDLVLSFRLLKKGGIILCDDSVTWGEEFKLQDTPRLAIDSFVQCNWSNIKLETLPNSYQTAFIKKSEVI